MSFSLYPALARDCIAVCDLPLCCLLLMNNRHFPWLVLVPRREGLRELYDLDAGGYQAVMNEVRSVAQQFAAHTGAHKMNIAALGNVVPQLHIHVIARFTNDAAWPSPVWNSGVTPDVYAPESIAGMIAALKEHFQAKF